jgi:hypothetical protein
MMTARSESTPRSATAADFPVRAFQGARTLVLAIGRRVGAAIRWYIEMQGRYYERTGAPYTDDFLM